MPNNPLHAGAAKGNITPKEYSLPLPFVFDTYFDRIVDHIYVRALDLDDGHKRILFITFDMCVIPYPEETMQFICDYTGLEKEYVFVSATHNHEVPILGVSMPLASTDEEKNRDWYREIQRVLKDTIDLSGKNKKRARIGYGTGKSYINVNRDEIIDGKAILGNNFERPSDKTLALVRIEDEDGKPLAFIINYAVHAVVMNGCVVNNGIGICGDLPGKTSAILEERFPGATAFWTSGAAGDQNPRIMTAYGTEMRDGKLVVKSLGTAGYMILDFLTDEHVRDILKVNDSLVCHMSDGRIFAAERTVQCPLKPSSTSSADSTQKAYTLRLMTVGDIAFEGISAEVVTSIGTALKTASPCEKIIVVTNVSNYDGYVTDDWGYENNTFEAEGTPIEKGSAQPAFLQGFTEMFSERGM